MNGFIIKAEISEIDENLIRHELTLLERAEQLQKRKEIYEIMFPETKKGGDWRSVKKPKRNNFVSFSKDTAKITGNSVRTIEHEIQIVNNLPLDVRKTIKNTDLADSKVELLSLSRLDIKTQKKVVKIRLKNNNYLTVSEIVKDLIVKTKIQALEKERTEFLVRRNTTSKNIELFHGDCRAIFPTIAERLKKQGVISKVLIITDPPYNIKFQKYNDYNDNRIHYLFLLKWLSTFLLYINRKPEQLVILLRFNKL